MLGKMELLNIHRMGPLVTRILGQNPGKFTLQGTNTYLIGRSAPYILIDTGEGKPEYIPQLRTTLESSSNGQCPISDIIITHKHQDHHGGLIDVLDFLSSQRSTNSTESWHPPCIHLHPLPAGVTDSSLTATISRLKFGDFTPKSDCTVLFPLSDGHQVQTADASAMLEVVHTPGHTADSISLILFDLSEAKSPVPVALFTADTVLGAGTAVFEDLSLYMQSLRRLVELPIWTHSITLHPGHGPAVPPESSKSHIETYISHRQARENQIVDVFKKSHGKTTVGHLVESLYAEYPRTLWPAAAHSVGLHLQKLGIEGKIKRLSEKPVSDVGKYDGVKMEQVGAAGMDAEWEWAGFEAPGTETKL